jgi:23S rRNA (uridine2479-2'-O)-methyltransferase
MRIERENAELQLLEALRHNRRKREQRREFLVEGVQAIDRCVASGWSVRAVVTPLGAGRSRWAQSVLDALHDAQHLELSPSLFQRVADRDEPPELLLVASIPARGMDDVPRPADGVVALVDRPASPGNLGTILRTSDALGAAGVLISGHGAHLYDPRTIRASVGSLFSIPAVPVPGHDALVEWLEEWRASAPEVVVYATDEDGDVVLDGSTRLRRPALVLLGSERTGLSTGLRELADVAVAIPMAGSASSLNVGVAHGIVLHHLLHLG